MCELLSNNSLFVGQLYENKSLAIVLVIWSSLQLTSKQWIIKQQFTAGADLFLKYFRILILCGSFVCIIVFNWSSNSPLIYYFLNKKKRKSWQDRFSPPKLLAGFWPNLVGMILIWPSLKIVQMVLVHCISRSHRIEIDFQDENFKNLLIWNHKA